MGRALELTGQRFGKLTVVRKAEERKRGCVQWVCECDCGNFATIPGKDLKYGTSTTCGCAIRADLVGKRYGRLVVLEKTGTDKRNAQWLCQCDCGNERIVKTPGLQGGNTKSCGCINSPDITGQQFGYLTVVERTDELNPYNGSRLWRCSCSKCGGEGKFCRGELLKGSRVTCGCGSFVDLTGKRFGELKVIRRLCLRTWECRCDCGVVCEREGQGLRENRTRHCGGKTHNVPEYRNVIANRMRVRINQTLKEEWKSKSMESLVGYSAKELCDHLERQFIDDMSWDNIGEWHIDHVVPLSSFEVEEMGDAEFKACWALPNLRPLWAADNIRKHAKMEFLL